MESNDYKLSVKKRKKAIDETRDYRIKIPDYYSLKRSLGNELSKYATKQNDLITVKSDGLNKALNTFSLDSLDFNANILINIGGSKYKLMREYHRNQMMRAMIMLERNHKYNLELERFLLVTLNESKINTQVDPVTGANFDLKYMKQSFSKQFDDKIMIKIKSMIDEFNNMTEFPMLTYGYERQTDTYYCGNYQKKLIPIVKEALIYKLELNGYKDKQMQTELILTSLLRYESIVNLYEQWSMPLSFYEHLIDRGYNLEAMSSPFNCQMLVVDYVKKTNKTKFCSLFPDVDEPFGCIGNFFTTDISKYKAVVTPPITLHDKTVDYIIKNKLNNLILLTFKHDIDRIVVMTDDYYLENKTLISAPVYFNYGKKLHIHIIDDSTHVEIDLSYLRNKPENMKKKLKYETKLAIEWARYQVVKKITSFKMKDMRTKREYMNIIERLLLAMANLPKSNDEIFKKLDLKNDIYVKAAEEMTSKRIDNRIIKQIKELIDGFLDNRINKKLSIPVSYGYSGYGHYYCGDYERVIDNNRNIALIKRLKEPQYFNIIILTCMLRYECILSLGQHWNFPFVWYEYLYNEFNLRFEGFASPFNSQLLLAEKSIPNGQINYCSLFYDTDKYFGSIGNIFELDIKELPKINNKLTIAVNPPYVESIIESMIKMFDKWFSSGITLTIFTGVPGWHDANFMSKLKNYKYKVYDNELFEGQYYYEISNNPFVPRIKHKSSLVTFVLSNDSDIPDTTSFDKITAQYNTVKY